MKGRSNANITFRIRFQSPVIIHVPMQGSKTSLTIQNDPACPD